MIYPSPLLKPFYELLVWPILNVLIGIYQGLLAIHIPYALGFAIIILTVIIRLILYPLTMSQLRASHKMQKLTPHLTRLKEKHKNDSKMLQAETMKLYKEHGVNPLAGCLPALIQLPLIWALYGVLRYVVNTKPQTLVSEINRIVYLPFLKIHAGFDQYFFGLPLGHSPSQLLKPGEVVTYLILIFPIATALFQFLQSKMMFVATETVKKNGIDLEKIKKGKPSGAKTLEVKKKSDDFSSAMQTQSLYIFPVMIGYFSFTLPLGLSLYWNAFTIFGIIQQYQIQKWGGLQPWIDLIKSKVKNQNSKV